MVASVDGYFIIDVSALTKGLGNIKKWVEYDDFTVKLFIPSYTIHELDYLKKGTTMIARNAREGIRFIDKHVSSDENPSPGSLILETPNESGPNWKTCIKYKIRSPKTSEFKVAKLNTSSVVKYEHDLNEDEVFDKNIDNSYSKVDDSHSTKAELPNRLKYLIRPCVKKTKLDTDDWKLITEDPSTKIWCESFGIKCISISEAESQLFESKNRSSTSSEISSSDDHVDLKVPEELNNNRKTRRGKRGTTTSNHSEILDDRNVSVERYNSISYAPRGSGELWIP